LRRRLPGLWESGNPAFGFPLFHSPHFFLLLLLLWQGAIAAEAVGMWKSRRSCEISKGVVRPVENRGLVFHAATTPVISTALFACSLPLPLS
jgi:hypothetical protein